MLTDKQAYFEKPQKHSKSNLNQTPEISQFYLALLLNQLLMLML